MKIQDIMSAYVIIIHPGASLKEARKRLENADISALPVVEHDHLVGMVNRAILDSYLGRGLHNPALNLEENIVADVMMTAVPTCFEDQDASDAIRMMESQKVSQLVILDREDRIAGMVSLKQLQPDQQRAVA